MAVTSLDPARACIGRHFTVNWAFDDLARQPRAYVYEVYEADPTFGFAAEHPVYVGMTGSFAARWSGHLSKTWWIGLPKVLCVILTGYETRHEARRVEAALIAEHDPIFNTKSERKFLRLAQELGVPEDIFTAELTPSGWGVH